MRVEFKCKCGEMFRVEGKYLQSKNELACPNCGASFPGSALDKIKQAAGLLVEARSALEVPGRANVVSSRPSYSWEFTFVDVG